MPMQPDTSTSEGIRPLLCRQLHSFDATNLDTVLQAFRPTNPIALRQAWLPVEETAFRPGAVRVGWNDESLLICAELDDEDIFTKATAANQRFWELGDVLEIFLQPANQDNYSEFQVTPGNLRLHLNYPNTAALQQARAANDISRFLVSAPNFESSTWIQPEHRKWIVLAKFAAAAIGDKPGDISGRLWKFSFGRYDYSRDLKEPVISSSSPHARPDFHCRKEWQMMRFEAQL